MHPLPSRFPLDGRGKGALPSPVLGRNFPRDRDVALLLNWQARAEDISAAPNRPPTPKPYSVGIPGCRPRFDKRS